MLSKKKGAKKKYKVTNWREYNTTLKLRGSLTIWISKEIEGNWYAHKAIYTKPGRQLKYSNQAIQMLRKPSVIIQKNNFGRLNMGGKVASLFCHLI